MTRPAEEKQWWYFTFGVNHPTGRYYISLFGTYVETQRHMEKMFGSRWGSQYSESEFAGQDEKYDLRKLLLPKSLQMNEV
jgi:hypothetical protein